MSKMELLLGDEAVAQGAIDAGISGAFSYPGTPSTEIFEYIEDKLLTDRLEISAHWSANEKVAYEEALGMSFTGRRALLSMKHVGLNVAADPFINSALTGVNGGIVLVVADDPGMHSSQNEQDSRYLADFAQIPVFEPSNQQEAYEMTRDAFEYSEAVGLPVMVRVVTRLAHSRANVSLGERAEVPPRGLPKNTSDWTLVPVHARRRFRHLLSLQAGLLEDSERSERNALTLAGSRGIIACGLGWNYAREALGGQSDFSLLKIGHYPLPVALLRQLVNHCDEILVVEDGYPFVERQLRGALGVPGKSIRGKLSEDLPASGELTPDLVAAALGLPVTARPLALDQLAARPPQLCRGCPHADSFRALVEATSIYPDAILFSDIGCYALGVMPPYRAVHACVDMGASIGMAVGAARGGHHPVLCTIGDSTFAHSGLTGILSAAHIDANVTVLILDNATTAMTGIQDSLLCGDGLVDALAGLGISREHIHVVEPIHKAHDDNVALIRRAVEHKGLSVVIPRRACIHVHRKEKSQAAKRAAAAAQLEGASA